LQNLQDGLQAAGAETGGDQDVSDFQSEKRRAFRKTQASARVVELFSL
jgi:hypothetical protein